MALRRKDEDAAKFLEVDASMQGTLAFKDPVNLQINGRFEGALQTRGSLIIGERAQVQASVEGEAITVAGRLQGDIKASQRLELRATARIIGNITTPTLVVQEGAVIQGQCDMLSGRKGQMMTVDELARYLEVDKRAVVDWAGSGRLPGIREGESWTFDRAKIDEWVANEKIR